MNGTNTKIKQALKEMNVDAIPQKLLVITAVLTICFCQPLSQHLMYG